MLEEFQAEKSEVLSAGSGTAPPTVIDTAAHTNEGNAFETDMDTDSDMSHNAEADTNMWNADVLATELTSDNVTADPLDSFHSDPSTSNNAQSSASVHTGEKAMHTVDMAIDARHGANQQKSIEGAMTENSAIEVASRSPPTTIAAGQRDANAGDDLLLLPGAGSLPGSDSVPQPMSETSATANMPGPLPLAAEQASDLEWQELHPTGLVDTPTQSHEERIPVRSMPHSALPMATAEHIDHEPSGRNQTHGSAANVTEMASGASTASIAAATRTSHDAKSQDHAQTDPGLSIAASAAYRAALAATGAAFAAQHSKARRSPAGSQLSSAASCCVFFGTSAP